MTDTLVTGPDAEEAKGAGGAAVTLSVEACAKSGEGAAGAEAAAGTAVSEAGRARPPLLLWVGAAAGVGAASGELGAPAISADAVDELAASTSAANDASTVAFARAWGPRDA